MPPPRLLLLGPPQIESNGRVAPVRLRKAVALVAYLAVEGRAFGREFLSALLWPNHPAGSALANLRKTLSQLRNTFADNFIISEGDQLRLDPAAIRVDVVEFQALLEPVPTDPDAPDADLERLGAAAALYRGQFLEGFNLGDCLEFDEWQDAVRERFAMEIDGVLEALCVGCLERGRPKEALPHALRWLEFDPSNEMAHRTLMEIYARTGREDLARRQYEVCVKMLAREDLEPDSTTRELRDTIIAHRVDTAPARKARARRDRKRARRFDRRRVLIPAVIVFALLSVASVAYGLRQRIFGLDPSVVELGATSNGEGVRAIEVSLANGGVRVRRLHFSVFFALDGRIGVTPEYNVYAGSTPLPRNGSAHLSIPVASTILDYVEQHNISIPPGWYTARIVLDPEDHLAERSEINNEAHSDAVFYFSGTNEALAITVEITCTARVALDESNPLHIFLGDRSLARSQWDWARFTVTEEGFFSLPLDQVPIGDNDDSGYFMMLQYDTGANLEDSRYVAPGDVAALYKEGRGNLVYGAFGIGGGTPMFPGGTYKVELTNPDPPARDAYEDDDFCELGLERDPAEFPLREYHTFHYEGNGDVDQDWFCVFVPAGQELTVETFSAESLWEADTQIDIADSQMNYITSNRNKADDDRYSRLVYRNTTGADQVFHILVKTHNHPDVLPPQMVGEYIVEFRY
jgi:DNA-binding SARP family transcriptional activator